MKPDEYTGMPHRFDVTDLLLAASHRRSDTYADMQAASRQYSAGGGIYTSTGSLYREISQSPALRTETFTGTPLRRQDALGRWYFMPVWVRSLLGELELPCAVVSVTGKKRIVETPLVGRRGTVNELIGVDSYEVNITAALIGEDKNYPEQAIKQMRDLYELNEAVELISALTDLIFEEDDKVVFDKIDFPSSRGSEDLQIVKLTAHTDAAVELILR